MCRVHAAALFLGMAAFGPPLLAGALGGNFEISGANCRFPDAALGIAGGKYLVVWADYNETRVFGRLVTDAGQVAGGAFRISEAPYGGLFPAVAYDALDDEFLVTWDDFGGRGETIHGQRVRASDGALLGKNFAIGSVSGGIRSAVAWSAAANAYLVVWFVPGAVAEIYGQRVSGAGALLGANLNISADGVFSGYPAVAWGDSGNQFLVTWDNEDGNIHGRRVAAGTGELLGATILVTSGGGKDRSCVAYDPLLARWLVQYNDGANAGFSYDQYGRFVSVAGAVQGSPAPLAHSAGFEGDTQFGGDVAFVPGARRFFSSFGTDTGMGGQESLSSGAPAAPSVTLGTGYYTSLNNAADPARNRFLTVWEGLDDAYRIFGQLYSATLDPPTDFTAEPGDSVNVLSWRNPADPQFTGTLIRFKAGGYPESPQDGEPLTDLAGAPGSTGSFVHSGLENWTTLYYAAFAHDAGPNYSAAARAAATPRPQAVTVLASDFSSGADGWTLTPWRSGTLPPGTIAWDPEGGNIVAAGSGVTNNRDLCTREGGSLTRAISTAGHHRIQVEYEVRASLFAPPAGSPSGNCAALGGAGEDQLVVSFSATGPGGPWTVAQVLTEGFELPTPWSRKLLNLAGLPAADDNPAFALRFEWQFNHERDSGRVDSIRVLSGAVTGPTPAIALSAERIERTVERGANLPGDSFWVSNSGAGVLGFQVREEAPWLSVSPEADSSAGPPRRVTVSYDTGSLADGEHTGLVEVVSAGASNSPQAVAIVVQVVPPARYRDPFSYYDGDLTAMGAANWSGTATDQLRVEKGVLRVRGGGGAVEAAHGLGPGGLDGSFEVLLKVRGAPGTGDFFWNFAVDDEAGANLARWYGGSTVVRGRIGGAITGDLVLSGPGAWDDLRVRIDVAANTSEFFFNGVSQGTIPHGTGPANRAGEIRFERFDRAGTGGDSIEFDDLVVGYPALRLFHRADPDASGVTDLTDAVAILRYLFSGGPAPVCAEAADSNDDGRIDVSDALAVLFYLFGGLPPPPPGPPGSPCGPGRDAPGSAGYLGCSAYAPCGA